MFLIESISDYQNPDERINVMSLFTMNKTAFLIVFALFSMTGYVSAQTGSKKDHVRSDNATVSQPADKTTTGIKVVPQARNKNAKPEKVGTAKSPKTRPQIPRSARNSRPSIRPARPGNGRN